MKSILAGALMGAILVGLAGAPTVRADAVSAAPAPEAATFAGTWKVADAKARVFFIDLKADGAAASRWQDPAESRRNQTGSWKLVEGAAVIVWDNGWRETIGASGAGFVKRAFAPGLKLDGKPSNETPAERAAATP